MSASRLIRFDESSIRPPSRRCRVVVRFRRLKLPAKFARPPGEYVLFAATPTVNAERLDVFATSRTTILPPPPHPPARGLPRAAMID